MRLEIAKKKKCNGARNNLTTRGEDLIAGRNGDGAIGFSEGRERLLKKKEESRVLLVSDDDDDTAAACDSNDLSIGPTLSSIFCFFIFPYCIIY